MVSAERRAASGERRFAGHGQPRAASAHVLKPWRLWRACTHLGARVWAGGPSQEQGRGVCTAQPCTQRLGSALKGG